MKKNIYQTPEVIVVSVKMEYRILGGSRAMQATKEDYGPAVEDTWE